MRGLVVPRHRHRRGEDQQKNEHKKLLDALPSPTTPPQTNVTVLRTKLPDQHDPDEPRGGAQVPAPWTNPTRGARDCHRVRSSHGDARGGCASRGLEEAPSQ